MDINGRHPVQRAGIAGLILYIFFFEHGPGKDAESRYRKSREERVAGKRREPPDDSSGKTGDR